MNHKPKFTLVVCRMSRNIIKDMNIESKKWLNITYRQREKNLKSTDQIKFFYLGSDSQNWFNSLIIRCHVCSRVTGTTWAVQGKGGELRVYGRKESQKKKIVWDNLLDLLRVTNRRSQKPLCSREALLQDELQTTLWYSWQAQFSVFPTAISVGALSITMSVWLWVCFIACVLSSPATEKNARDWVFCSRREYLQLLLSQKISYLRGLCFNKCIRSNEENAERAAVDGDKWAGLAYLYNDEILSLRGEKQWGGCT